MRINFDLVKEDYIFTYKIIDLKFIWKIHNKYLKLDDLNAHLPSKKKIPTWLSQIISIWQPQFQVVDIENIIINPIQDHRKAKGKAEVWSNLEGLQESKTTCCVGNSYMPATLTKHSFLIFFDSRISILARFRYHFTESVRIMISVNFVPFR